MPVVQVDWNEIKSKLADVTALYALTHRQASLLLALSQQLEWRKTFKVEDYDFSDWDLLEWETADINRNLTMPVDVEDFVTALNAIKNAIDAQADLMGEEECCENVDFSDGELFTDFVEEGVGDVPANIVSAGYADDSSDWDGFNDYKCVISHVMVWNLSAKVARFQNLFDTAGVIAVGIGAIAGILGIVFGGPAFWAVAGIAITTGAAALVFETLADEGESITDGLADEVLDNIKALSCAFYFGDGAEDSVAQMNAEINEIWNAPVSTLLTNMNMLSMAKSLFAGRNDQVNLAQKLMDYGLDVESVDCSCEPGEFAPEWLFTTEVESPWQTTGGYWYDLCGGGILMAASNNPSWLDVDDVRTHVGLAAAGEITLHKVVWTWYCSYVPGSHLIEIRHDVTTWDSPCTGPQGTCYEQEVVFDPPVTISSMQEKFIEISGAVGSNTMLLGAMKIFFDAD